MATRSVSQEAKDIHLATRMIQLGARLQVLQAETSLSYERLARLYREVRKESPPKGMLPFSVDWFTTWLPNIHATIFYSIYQYMNRCTALDKGDALVESRSEERRVGKEWRYAWVMEVAETKTTELRRATCV